MSEINKNIALGIELNLQTILAEPNFIFYKSIGLIDELALRNIIIREEYKLLRQNNPQLVSIHTLAIKHNLSFDSIHHILYRKAVKKRFLNHPLTNL